jgi:hypothetical protein
MKKFTAKNIPIATNQVPDGKNQVSFMRIDPIIPLDAALHFTPVSQGGIFMICSAVYFTG